MLFWLDTDRDTIEGKFLRFREVSHHWARFPCQILICTQRKLESAKAAKPFLTPKNGSVIPFFNCYSVLCELHRNIGVSHHFLTCLFPFFQCHMVLQDRLEKEKGFAKNAVESYVYDMRGRLYDKLQKYITEEVTWSNFRIPCNSFTCHWIRIASIVLCLDLQSLPTHVSEAEMSCGVFWSLAGNILCNASTVT